MFRKGWLQILSVFALMFAVIHMVRGYQTVPKLDPPREPASTPFGKTLAGSGMVEPETENISIGSDVPGIVERVAVKVGCTVPAGEILFELDPRQLRAEVQVRESALKAVRAQFDRLEKLRKEELPVTEAKVRESEAMLREAEDQLQRGRVLANQGAIAREEMMTRERAAMVSRAQLARMNAELMLQRSEAWKAELEVSRAAIVQAEAQLAATCVELDRLKVKARVAGRVLQVNVRAGEFVGAPAGQALIVLGSTENLHVRVDIDEHDIPRYRPGIPATASFRGDTSRKIPMRFVRIEPYVIPKKSLTGSNTERVDTRVLQVIYALASTEQPVFVGQQLDVFFNVELEGGNLNR